MSSPKFDVCPTCNLPFKNVKHHRRREHGYIRELHNCPYCGKAFMTVRGLGMHMKSHLETFPERPLQTAPEPLTEDIALVSDPIQPPSFSDLEPDVASLLQRNWQYIRSHVHISRNVLDKYVINLTEVDNWLKFYKVVESILESQTHSVKINCSFGFVLQNTATYEKVFFYASNNNMLFDDGPRTLNNRDEIRQFVVDLKEKDILGYCLLHRENTRFTVRMVTNCLLQIYKMKNSRIGCPVSIRDHTKKLKSVVTFAVDQHGMTYTDNLCFFRCVCKWRGMPNYRLETEAEVQRLANAWSEYAGCRRSGIAIGEIASLERWLRMNVNVYTQRKVRGEQNFYAHQVLRSKTSFKDTINLHLEGNHFCLITKLNTYARNWQCRKCKTIFSQMNHLKRHEPSCSALSKVRYAGGGFGSKKSLFDQIEELGFRVADSDSKFYKYRAFIDFECLFDKSDIDVRGVTALLEPVSVSVCSNVPGFTEPQCFVEINPNVLVEKMYDRLLAVSAAAAERMQECFADLWEEMESWIEQRARLVEQQQQQNQQEQSLDDLICLFSQVEPLLERLNKWLNQLVVLGFNSGKFDMNLARSYFFPLLLRKYDTNDVRIIKKINAYMLVDVPDFKFLDISNYVAPHTSYAAWLKSWDVPMEKGHFPYEWLTDFKLLDETKELVPKAYFYSSLKNCGISQEDYAHLVNVWLEGKFSNMRDFLMWYNNLDTYPGIMASDRMFEFWKSLSIDPFKGGDISLPGLAYAHMAKSLPRHTIIPICGPDHAEVHSLIKANITGGLSIVIHRYHEKDVTRLPNGSICKKLLSYDASSMYLSAFGKPMGTGLFRLWKVASGGVSVTPLRSVAMRDVWECFVHANSKLTMVSKSWLRHGRMELEWLEWMSFATGEYIEHRFNGRQKVFYRNTKTKYYVDGYAPRSKTVYQFHGCYFHGHSCWLNRNSNEEDREARSQKSDEVELYIQGLGFKVVIGRECDWRQMRTRTPLIQEFIDEHFTLGIKQSSITCALLVEMIESGQFFGFVECDIEVPVWERGLVELFADFPPICKNTLVSKDDVGEYMKAYAEAYDCFKQPRRCLISSYFAEKILLISPLLKWYLEHGLRITRIYSCIEMKPKTCFEHLRDEVANHRRRADQDPGHKALGTMWKLTGNNYYGKPLTDESRFKDLKICSEKEASRLVNSRRFYRLDEVDENTYEVMMNKKCLKISKPNHISSMVLGYAKLRNLEFVYDFLHKYLVDGSFKIVCSDTDSILAAYASANLDDLVKPELKTEYHVRGKKAFLVTDTYSERTPGIYHIECEGDGAIALCPKTYIVWRNNDQTTCKLSSKGLSKVTNHFSKDDFFRVLKTGDQEAGKNVNFRKFGTKLYQFEQSRKGISFLYTKRKTCNDGVTTLPLDL